MMETFLPIKAYPKMSISNGSTGEEKKDHSSDSGG